MKKQFRKPRPVAVEASPVTPSWTPWGIGLLLVVAVALVYGKTAGFSFVNFDDQDYVYDNPRVLGGLTWSGIVWAFTHFHASNWHPLTWLSHMLDVELFGTWAGGHHLTNVLLHATSAVVLFLVLQRTTRRLWPSALVAALFAIHPLHVESVAWVAERKDVLSGLFFMLTLAAYWGYVRRPFARARYLLVVAAYAAGLLSKPMLVTLPFVLWLLDYWPLGRWSAYGGPKAVVETSGDPVPVRRVVMEKLPLMLLAALSCVITMKAQTAAVVSTDQIPFAERIAHALVAYATYLRQSVWPAGLTAFYPLAPGGPSLRAAAGAGVLLAALTVGAVALRRRRPYILIGWLWYLGMLVPVIGLVQVGLQARADRYMYLPLIGPALALAWAVAEFAAVTLARRRTVMAGAGLALVLLGGVAWRQTQCWRNSEALWTHALTHTSNNHIALNNLGLVWDEQGRIEEAVAAYRKAVEIRPGFDLAHYNLGNALFHGGRLEDALAAYGMALRINPAYAEAHYNRGLSLDHLGRTDEAIAAYRKTLALQPDHVGARNNLGLTLAGQGKIEEAIAEYQAALSVKPDYAEAHFNLGNALASLGRTEKAGDAYRKALEIQPMLVTARFNLGNALFRSGKVEEAIVEYTAVLNINPDYAEAHFNLGNALANRGRTDTALAHFLKAKDLALRQGQTALAGAAQDKIRLLETPPPARE